MNNNTIKTPVDKYVSSLNYRQSADSQMQVEDASRPVNNPRYIAWMADQVHDGPSTVSGSSAWRRPAPVVERPASAPLPSVEGN